MKWFAQGDTGVHRRNGDTNNKFMVKLSAEELCLLREWGFEYSDIVRKEISEVIQWESIMLTNPVSSSPESAMYV